MHTYAFEDYQALISNTIPDFQNQFYMDIDTLIDVAEGAIVHDFDDVLLAGLQLYYSAFDSLIVMEDVVQELGTAFEDMQKLAPLTTELS